MPLLQKDPFRQSAPIHVRTWRGIADTFGPTLRFLMETEAHVYAFSIAANVLLSFFPFLLTMMLLCRWVFHWEPGARAILFAVSKCFPDYHKGTYLDISGALNEAAWGRHHVGLFSILLLFFTANGIFEPLEVALNRAWRVPKNRSYLKNQIVSLGLIFFCGGVALLSTVIISSTVMPGKGRPLGAISSPYGIPVGFRIITLPLFMTIIFAIYWILPNRKIPARRLVFPAIVVGLLLSLLNLITLATWPLLFAKLRGETGPFVHSVSILLWSFFGSLIVLAGAEWSARVTIDKDLLDGD